MPGRTGWSFWRIADDYMFREGISLHCFCRRCGVSCDAMRRCRAEWRFPAQLSQVVAIASELGVGLDYLVMGTGPAPDPIGTGNSQGS